MLKALLAVARVVAAAHDKWRTRAAPRWIVSDHGPQLTSKSFAAALRRRAISRRFGAVHRSGSIAVIEIGWTDYPSSENRWVAATSQRECVPLLL